MQGTESVSDEYQLQSDAEQQKVSISIQLNSAKLQSTAKQLEGSRTILAGTSSTIQPSNPHRPIEVRPPSSATSENSAPAKSAMKPNQVRTVLLNGTPIVALVIDGKERLCLAQISNTLLKSFSYNEIHNRRVALGITCVQCTPVQLEILRRAGAMPISSRRCGMISKREAERLCKSFLTENCPPKLPDNFSFEVIHECAWGCRGSFLPSRYNSSRAKCIKCSFCNMFFSPNKFIFHSHRLPESKYVQPDAANFNSWRRHLKLSGTPMDEVIYAWEDVKAMFNGGSRKRVMAASYSRFQHMKRPKIVDNSTGPSGHSSIPPPSIMSSGISTTSDTRAPPPYVSMLPYHPSNKTSFAQMSSASVPNPYLSRGVTTTGTTPCTNFVPTSVSASGCPVIDKGLNSPGELRGPSFVDYIWAGKPGGPPLPPSTYGFIWPSRQQQQQHHQGLPSPVAAISSIESKLSPGGHFYDDRNFRDDTCSESSSRGNCDSELETTVARRSVSSCSEPDVRSSDNDDHLSTSGTLRAKDTVGFLGPVHHHHHHQIGHCVGGDKSSGYCSAFRPVIRANNSSGASLHSVESLIQPSSTTTATTTVKVDDSLGPDRYSGGPGLYPVYSDIEAIKESCPNSRKSIESDNVIDVEVTDDSKEADEKETKELEVTKDCEEEEMQDEDEEEEPEVDFEEPEEEEEEEEEEKGMNENGNEAKAKISESSQDKQQRHVVHSVFRTNLGTGPKESVPLSTPEIQVQKKGVTITSCAASELEPSENQSNGQLDSQETKSQNLTKEELQEILFQETQARRRAEKQCEAIKETFQEQVKREVAYREEITKQLEIVKGTLCNELDQERKARFAVLQKLKEAHDALHHFSCKVLIPRQCNECSYKPILPQ